MDKKRTTKNTQTVHPEAVPFTAGIGIEKPKNQCQGKGTLNALNPEILKLKDRWPHKNKTCEKKIGSTIKKQLKAGLK